MKAYYCDISDNVCSDYFGEIVFAKSRNEARQCFSYDYGIPYIDSRARRVKWADELPREGRSLVLTVENMEIMREHNFFETDNPEWCERCGKVAWESLPTSELDCYGICGYCRKEKTE